MSRNRELADIIAGGFTEADIPNLSASKITSGTLADARISASSVSQHAQSFDDNKIVNDISTLAIRQASNENKTAYNTQSMFVDVFQDSSAINLTNVTNVDEYLASAYENKVQFIPSLHRTSDYNGALGTASWNGGENTANSQHQNSGSQYSGTIVNELWDLSGDWQCNVFIGNSNQGGSISTLQYPAFTIVMTDSTTLTAGSDPDIFTASTASTAYGSSASQFQDDTFINSTGRTGMNTSALSNGSTFRNFDTGSHGTGDKSYDANNNEFGVHGYYNDGNAWGGASFVYDKSAGTVVFQPFDGSLNKVNNGKTTISNVPSSGRAIILFGDAYNQLRTFQTSYLNGNKANDDFSYKTTSVLNATGTVESNAITAPSSVNKMGAIITYQDAVGTNTLNTDLVLKLSADNGVSYTTATLTAMPDFASGIKMAKVNDLTIGSAGTSLKYKLEFANQGASKSARVRGVALQF